jgi:hypothetical protein
VIEEWYNTANTFQKKEFCMSDIKLLCVLSYYRMGVIVPEDAQTYVYVIRPGRELGLGFARIANVDGTARFLIVQDTQVMIDMTPDLIMPPNGLNSQIMNRVCDRPFEYGDVAEAYYCYEEKYYVCQELVVLVPSAVPATVQV